MIIHFKDNCKPGAHQGSLKQKKLQALTVVLGTEGKQRSNDSKGEHPSVFHTVLSDDRRKVICCVSAEM
eukprot:4975265-Pleurochrysis_carterae.AAC.1